MFVEKVAEKKDTWATVTNKNKPRVPSIRKQSNWRTKNVILHGSSEDNSVDSSLAADVSLVAFGVAKDASADKLKAYLEKKGLKIVSCDLLTKHVNEARTHSYKVTMKASEYEKAKDPLIWPYRVGVRLFKHLNSKPRDNRRQEGWGEQSKAQSVEKSEEIPLHNRFQVLGSTSSQSDALQQN